MKFGRRIYPGDVPIQLDGGLNNKFEPSIIGEDESPDCLNVVFSNGSVGTRKGSTKLNTAAVGGSYVCDGLYTRHDQTGAETMVAFFGSTMYGFNGTSGITISSSQSLFTAGIRVAACEYQNQMFIGNGGVIPYKYNGAYFTRHGIYPQTTTATVASSAGGVLTGEYQYKITNVNSYSVESDVGPRTSTLTAAAGRLTISSIQTFAASYGVSARKIYRTIAGGSTFKLLTTISDNTTTSYVDNNADSTLGATAPTDQGVPPMYSTCIYHQNRLFMNDPNNLNYFWYSELGEPHVVKVTNFKKVGDNSSDLVRGFGVYDNALYVFCDNSVWLIYLQDPSDDTTWQSIKVKSAYGSKSPFCILNIENQLLFGAVQNDKFLGFGEVSGAALQQDATFLTVSAAGSDLISNRIEPDMFQVVDTYAGNISGIVYQNKAYIALTYSSGNNMNNRVYVYDFSVEALQNKKKPVWVPYTGWNAAQFTIWDGSLYYGSSTATGFIYKCEQNAYSDDGTAINSYYWTKEYSGFEGEYNYNKDFRYGRILVDLPGDYYMGCSYRVNSDSGAGTEQQVDLDPGGSLWGAMVWGVGSWGGGNNQLQTQFFLDGARGKRIQFKFSNLNTAGQRFKVHWLSFAYNLKGFR